MSTLIRQLKDNSGNNILPATRSEAVYMSDDSTLNDLMASPGVVKKALGDKNGKDITSYLTGLSVSGKTITFSKGDGTSGTINTQDTTYPEASDFSAGLMSVSMYAKLSGIEDGANKYIHPSFTAQKEGFYKVTINNQGHVSAVKAVTKGDITALGIPGQDTTYSVFAGSSSGLVPSVGASDAGKFLKADGTWATPANTTYNVATQSSNGLMSSTDKTKLDGIAPGANNYVHPSYTAKSSGMYKITVDSSGHVSAATAISKTDITGLGIPAQDTTYTNATSSKAGLMSASDKSKLDNIPANSLGYVEGWGKIATDLPSLTQ